MLGSLVLNCHWFFHIQDFGLMRKFYLSSTLVLTLLFSSTSYAQDFSNKGKEFWVCFPQHVPSGSVATLSIWITSDKASTGMVTMTNGAFSAPFNIPANGLQEIQVPHALAHISNAESFMVIQKSIKIKTDPGKPAVVAYAQQWGNARSAATLLLPVNVLSRKYYATSFTQLGVGGGGQNAKSQFQVIATKPNTVVKVTPRTNGTLGASFVITLPNAGDMYQYQADQDLTGTLIESTAGAGGVGCLPIAVFSGSSNITFGTNTCGPGNSYDPLFQQQYPISSWGKNFGFVPFGDYPNGNPYRVLASEDNTKVFFDGVQVATLNEGQIYPATFNSNPVVLTSPINISADKPIAVIQYAQNLACSGGGYGDPDMVLLNPIEQNIKDITIFSSAQQAITHQWINVVMQTIATPSFKISFNGGPLLPPTAVWQPFFGPLAGYSYLRQPYNSAPGSYRLLADSGFNAIAYGFGTNFESYAYSAGTNVKDLYQQIGIVSQYGIDPIPSICVGAPFRFKVSLPYCADSIRWDLSNMPGPPAPPPTLTYTSCVPGVGGPDSITVVNGKTIYWYSLPLSYTVNLAGVYNITINTYAPNSDGCGNEQQFDFDLNVFDPPVGNFTFTTNNGCSNLPVQFTETTPQVPKTTYNFWWDFDDPGSGPANNSTLRNPTHLFSGPGIFNVRYVAITTPGCLTDTITHQVILNAPPVADFTVGTPLCINVPIQFTDNSTPGVTSWAWTFGDGGTSTIPNPTHTYLTAGVFTVTLQVTTATGCPSIPFTQQITIGDNGTLNLTSAPGTDNQTVCINTPITNITYSVGGGGTGGTVSGLPAGVTSNFAGGVITISGTPTVSGTFNYSVATTGACTNPSVNGTITVNADGTLTLSSAAGTDNQTVCINTPIANITYAVGGGGTGGSVSGLPAGVFGNFAGGVITISGSPSVAGTFNYTVNTTGPCINPTALGRIVVTADGTLTLTSAPGTNNQTVCINNPIINITYAVGGSGTGGSVSGLPAGVTGSFAGGVITITGTPTVPGVFNYTVSTTGPCGIPTAGGTITVNADGTLTLSSAAGTDNQTVCINTPIANITYAVGGGGTGGSVSGLPAGVFGNFAGGVITISGSPSVAGTFNYTVNTTGICINPTALGRIVVTANGTLTLTSAPGTNNQTVCINNPIVNITYAVGGTGTGGSVSGLPTGVTGSFAGGVITITGTPTVNGVFNYTVTTTGPCGIPTANGTITVNNDGTLTLTSGAGSNNQTVCINTPIVNITYSISGGGTGGSVIGLPAGVFGNFAGGMITISGSPSVAGTFNYTVNTTGPCINPTASGTITVTADGTLTLTSAPGTNNQTVCINNPIINITYAVGGSGTGGSVTGLPAGVTGNFVGGVITITGTPTVSGTFNYTVNTTGPCVKPSAIGTITVRPDGTITLTSGAGTDNQNACINNPIITITYAVGGSGTGGSVSGLPPGVTGTFSGGVITISGIPTAGGIFNYTVTTTGPCVTPGASGTINVTNVATITLTSAPGTNNQTVCINTAITNITYLVGGSGTGGTISGLPAGVTGSFAGGVITISGTPTAVGTFNYTVNTTGPCGTPSANGTITVNDNSTLNLSSGPGSNIQTVCINTAINNITYTIGGGGTGASITVGSLPAGVNGIFSGGVFTISGTPTVSGTFNFTVGTSGPCINPTASGTITVTADATLTLTSAAGTNNQTLCINTPITNITYSVGGTGTGGSVSGLPVGVTGTFAGGVITITGTPSVPGTFNYTVSTTGPCVKPTATGTITVNDNSTLSLSSAPGSNVQTVCINTAISDIRYTVGGGGTGASITAGSLPAGVSGSFSGGVFTISGLPTASGTFNFTVGTTGPCINTLQSGTITVTADATLSLTSSPGTSNQAVCVNNSITNISYSIGGSGSGASITAGSLPAGVNGVYSGGVFTISGTPTVSGTFNFTVGSTGPCMNPSLIGTLTVNPDHTMSLSSAASTTNQTVCSDKAITPIAYTLGGGATGATVTGLPAGVTSSVSGSTLTISGFPATAGVFNYSIITTGNSCIKSSANGTISVLQTPAITFDPVSGVCADVPSFQVTASPALGVFSGPGINATGLFNPAAAGAGNHIIRYTFTSANGCTNFKEQTLSVFPMPPTNAGPDKFMLEGGQVTLTPALNASMPVTYLWSPPQYLSDPTIAYTIASPPVDFNYTLTVTTDNGCALSDNVFVKVLKKPAIPNIFSPNGDGIHDTWVIEYLDTYPGSTVDIFNRYGQKIFHSEGYTKPWDGTVNGKPVPIGTYYYIVNPKNGRTIMSGYVDVIR